MSTFLLFFSSNCILTFGIPQYCASTCAHSGCTRHASCVDSKQNKTKIENNIAGLPSSRATSEFPQHCVSSCARFGCTRHTSCVDSKPKKSKKERKLFRTIVPIQSFPPKKILNKQIDHFKKTFHNLNTLPTYKYIHFKTTFMCPGSIAGVPLSQALPGFLITAPSSVLVPAVIGALAVWIQNQKTTKKAPVNL